MLHRSRLLTRRGCSTVLVIERCPNHLASELDALGSIGEDVLRSAARKVAMAVVIIARTIQARSCRATIKMRRQRQSG
jgi:hypothetical protein